MVASNCSDNTLSCAGWMGMPVCSIPLGGRRIGAQQKGIQHYVVPEAPCLDSILGQRKHQTFDIVRDLGAIWIFKNWFQEVQKVGGQRAPDAWLMRNADHGKRQITSERGLYGERNRLRAVEFRQAFRVLHRLVKGGDSGVVASVRVFGGTYFRS